MSFFISLALLASFSFSSSCFASCLVLDFRVASTHGERLWWSGGWGWKVSGDNGGCVRSGWGWRTLASHEKRLYRPVKPLPLLATGSPLAWGWRHLGATQGGGKAVRREEDEKKKNLEEKKRRI